MLDEPTSRRKFIRQLAYSLAAGCAGSWLETRAEVCGKTTKPGRYKISEWTGDNFVLGHRLRDMAGPKQIPVEAECKFDFVIIGGGIAGLTTAFYLKDANFLLLEQYSELGGQSRGGSYRGIDYSIGAAYIDTVDGIFGELYSQLGLNPVKLPKGDNSWFWEGRWYTHLKGNEEAAVYRDFKRLLSESDEALKKMPVDESLESLSSGAYGALDLMPFAANLKGYSQQFICLIDNISKWCGCGDSRQINSIAGYWLMLDLDSQNYCFNGGNSAITKALASKLEQAGSGRLCRNTFVWQVDLKSDGASVVYTTKDGAVHRVNCKHVILAVPPLVTSRFVKNLDDHMRANLLGFKYGSYFVANCLMNKKLFNGTYDNWFCSPYSFADIVVAETPYQVSNQYKPGMGSVLTVYQPYTPGSPGRALLYEGNRKKFASSTYSQIGSFIEGLDKHLEEIVLTRWGHAMVVSGPGFFTKLQKIQSALTDAPYSLAHSSYEGMPCAESAIRAARKAADRAVRLTKPISWNIQVDPLRTTL